MIGFSKDSILQDPNLISITTLMPTATDPCKRVFSIFTIIIREPQRQIRDRTNKIAPISPSPIFKNQGIRGLLVRVTPYLSNQRNFVQDLGQLISE